MRLTFLVLIVRTFTPPNLERLDFTSSEGPDVPGQGQASIGIDFGQIRNGFHQAFTHVFVIVLHHAYSWLLITSNVSIAIKEDALIFGNDIFPVLTKLPAYGDPTASFISIKEKNHVVVKAFLYAILQLPHNPQYMTK